MLHAPTGEIKLGNSVNTPLAPAHRSSNQSLVELHATVGNQAVLRMARMHGNRLPHTGNIPEIRSSSGSPLPAPLRAYAEGVFRSDLHSVRLHTGAEAARAASRVSARAFTVDDQIYFGRNWYQPSTTVGLKLIGHELAHVVQQRHGLSAPDSGGAGDRYEQEAEAAGNAFARGDLVQISHNSASHRKLQRSIDSGAETLLMRDAATSTDALPELDYKLLADQIHKAIAIPGTDEESVYRALQALDRNQLAIDELKRVYLREHRVSLLDDIYDDFSGEELEYALQLLNMGEPEAAQRVESAPQSPLDITRAATRIRDAVERIGTDEEAIFAVLLPFKQATLSLQNEYYRLYGEDLRDRLIDELSGDELTYALELAETPMEHFIQEGNEKLAGAPFGSFGDISKYCFAEEQETSAGVTRIYWYDREYWESDVDPVQHSCKVKLLPGKSAAAAIDTMFDHQDRWKIACAEFVQIVHLYALRHTLGAKQFDQVVASGGFTLEVKRRASTVLETDVTFSRKGPREHMVHSIDGQLDPRSVDEILASAPIGSRVRWTNLSGIGRDQPNPWEHENTIKLGPNKFGAHGTASGVFSKSNTHTRQEVEWLTARATNPNADMSYIRANLFISEIEIFRDPGRRVTS